MSAYIRVADRKAQEVQEKLRAGLQAVADKAETNEQTLAALSKLADLHISEQRNESRVGPLKETIREQSKTIRALKEQIDSINEQLTVAQNRITELENEKTDVTEERDGLKSGLSRLGATLSQSRTTAKDAEINASKASKQAAEANSKAENLTLNFQTVLSGLRRLYGIVKFDEAFTTKLFFELGDSAVVETFAALGWTEERFAYWTRARNVTKNKTSEQLVEFIHPAGAGCVSHRNIPKEEDQRIVEGLLRSRGVVAEDEVKKLQLQHLEEYRRNNPIPTLDFRGPVIRTPVACDSLEANRYLRGYSSDPEA